MAHLLAQSQFPSYPCASGNAATRGSDAAATTTTTTTTSTTAATAVVTSTDNISDAAVLTCTKHALGFAKE